MSSKENDAAAIILVGMILKFDIYFCRDPVNPHIIMPSFDFVFKSCMYFDILSNLFVPFFNGQKNANRSSNILPPFYYTNFLIYKLQLHHNQVHHFTSLNACIFISHKNASIIFLNVTI